MDYQKTSRTGCLALFGLPFFLAGSFFFYMGLTTEEINEVAATPAGRLGLCAFSSVFIAVGLALISGFSRVRVSQQGRILQRYWGVLWVVPLRWKTLTLEQAVSVKLKKEVRVSSSSNGGSSRRTLYVVYLAAGEGAAQSICELSTAHLARSQGEALAKSCGVSLFDDMSEGETVERKCDELDLSLGDALRDRGEGEQWPDKPEASRIVVDESMSSGGVICRLTLPNLFSEEPKFGMAVLGVLAALTGLLAFHWVDGAFWSEVGQVFDGGEPKTTLIHLFAEKIFSFYSVLLFAWAALLKMLITRGLASVHIAFTSDKIRISRKWGWLGCTSTMPFADLEELRLNETGKRGRLIVISDRKEIVVAQYRTVSELNYVKQVIEYHLAK